MNNQLNPAGSVKFTGLIPGIAWFFITLFLFCLPGSEIPTVDGWWNYIYLDKWIHVGIFALLSFLFMYPILRSAYTSVQKRDWLIKITLASITWGLTVECIQGYFVAGRSFDLLDWAADSFGAILALIYGRSRIIKNLNR